MAEHSIRFNGDRFDDLDRLIAEALEENRLAMQALASRIAGDFRHVADVHNPEPLSH